MDKNSQKTIYNSVSISEISDLYYTRNRFYHNIFHIRNMLEWLNEFFLTKNEKGILEKAILFHDAGDTPEESCDIYSEWFDKDPDSAEVKRLIMATKDHDADSSDKLASIIVNLDLKILYQPIHQLIQCEQGVFREFQKYSIKKYVSGRVDFLTNLQNKLNTGNRVSDLIDYVKNRVYRIGIYPGSFNPFHIGHADIVHKAELVFDKVVIARGINVDKETPGAMFLPADFINEVIEYNGLVSDLFHGRSSVKVEKFFVRGLRNVYDMGYEEGLRKVIHDIDPKIQFVYFFCDPKFEHISSSVIRGLMKDKSKEANELIHKYLVK